MEDHNLILEQDGEIQPGEYSKIEIHGKAENTGAICAKTIKVTGSAEFVDSVEAGVIDIDGDLEADGIIRAEELKVNGNLKCSGVIEVLKLTVIGDCELSGEITGKEVVVEGNVTLEGTATFEAVKVKQTLSGSGLLQTKQLEVEGRISYEGEIQAETFFAKSFHKGFIKTLKAGEVQIVHPFFLRHPTSMIYRDLFSIETIECKKIYAESIGVSTLRAENVELSKKCVVEEVFYLDQLTAASNCEVVLVEQIGAN